MSKQYLSRSALAQELGISDHAVRRWEKAGRLEPDVISGGRGARGRTILYAKSAVTRCRELLAEDEPVVEMVPIAAPPPYAAPMDPAEVVSLLESLKAEARLSHSDRDAFLAALHTLTEEVRALRALWEK